MNFRDVLKSVSYQRFDDDIRHDKVVDFIHSKDLRQTPLLLNVEGKKLATNFLATRDLICGHLGICREDFAPFMVEVSKRDGEITLGEEPEQLELKERKAKLSDLPVPKYFPHDKARYITAGCVISRLPWSNADDVDAYNVSIHRMMVLDDRRAAIRLVQPRHTFLMWQEAVGKGKELPIAVSISPHPLFMLAASTRTDMSEFRYAAKLMGKLELFRLNDMLIPDSEIILFGRITAERVEEGPFVDLTGTYDRVRLEPVVEFDAMFVKDNPVYYSITPADYEHQLLMGLPYEGEIYKAVSRVCRVRNVVLTAGGRHYFHAIVQIEKKREGDGKNAILAAFTGHPSLKRVVVVDEDINIYSSEDVEYAIATRFQAGRDLVVVKGARGSSLDPSAYDNETSDKWGIDATKELGQGEKYMRVL
jgi:UbiD family decarboxylase